MVCAAAAVMFASHMINRYYPLQHFDIINTYAQENGVAPELIYAVILAESGFNERAVSRAGASGLMQIIESTAYWIADRIEMDDFEYSEQIFAPEINIRMGSYYLGMLKKQYGDTELALSAYNAGRGNVDKWLGNPDYSSDGKTLDVIPFPETREYVRRVADSQKVYAVLLKHNELVGYVGGVTAEVRSFAYGSK